MRSPPAIMCAAPGAERPRAAPRRRRGRDQSYFLFATTPERNWTCCAFPWATCPKRRFARSRKSLGFALPTRPIPRTSVSCRRGATAMWWSAFARARPSPARSWIWTGRVLGTHPGIIHFTVGQRKGLGLSGNEEPLFVVRLDAPNRRVVVGPREALRTRNIRLAHVNWLGERGGDWVSCLAKVRSTRARHARAGERSSRARAPRWSCSKAKTRWRPARLASSTKRTAPACSAAAGSSKPNPPAQNNTQSDPNPHAAPKTERRPQTTLEFAPHDHRFSRPRSAARRHAGVHRHRFPSRHWRPIRHAPMAASEFTKRNRLTRERTARRVMRAAVYFAG